VRIDVSHAHFWDLTAVGTLDKVVLKFRRESAEVGIIGLNEASATIVDKLAEHDKSGRSNECWNTELGVMGNIQQSTSNAQHPSTNREARLGCSMFPRLHRAEHFVFSVPPNYRLG
jgi:MFS superfamily sulfate permease-like transporter